VHNLAHPDAGQIRSGRTRLMPVATAGARPWAAS
jgi:hypothetical protein